MTRTASAAAPTCALQRRILGTRPCTEWRVQKPNDRLKVIVKALRLLRAASVVSGLSIEEIAANRRNIASPEHTHDRRIIRATIGVVARINGVSPQSILLASGELLARGPITDGATWGARDGFAVCRPTIEAVITEFARTPATDEDAKIAAAIAGKMTLAAARPVQQERNHALFSTAKGRHEDDPRAERYGVRVSIPVGAM